MIRGYLLLKGTTIYCKVCWYKSNWKKNPKFKWDIDLWFYPIVFSLEQHRLHFVRLTNTRIAYQPRHVGLEPSREEPSVSIAVNNTAVTPGTYTVTRTSYNPNTWRVRSCIVSSTLCNWCSEYTSFGHYGLPCRR